MNTNICEFCGCDIEVEREVFGGDKLFTGHSCKGSGITKSWKIEPEETYLLAGIGVRQLVMWSYLDSTLYPMSVRTQPSPLPYQIIGRN